MLVVKMRIKEIAMYHQMYRKMYRHHQLDVVRLLHRTTESIQRSVPGGRRRMVELVVQVTFLHFHHSPCIQSLVSTTLRFMVYL